MKLNPKQIVDNVFKQADRLETGKERQATLTGRQKIDMTSRFILPQIIRPLLAVWGAVTYTAAQVYCLYLGLITGLEAMTANGAIVLTIIGFYFDSRRREKVNAKQTEAAIEISKQNAREARREARHERRIERLAQQR